MIIGIQSSSKKKNNIIGITALLSSITSINCNAKTLVLQFQNPTSEAVEEVFDKEMYEDESENKGKYSFEQNGIDSLLYEATKGELQRGVIESKSKSFLATKEESILNVVEVSKQLQFETITDDYGAIKRLLSKANEEFEYVFVVLPRREELKKEILKLCHYNIMCVPQGFKANVISFDSDIDTSKTEIEGQKDIYVVADFDEESSFSLKKTRNFYNTKTAYACYHNAEYKDAYINRRVLNFVRSNIKVTSEENNYSFISELKTLIGEFATETREDGYVDNMLVADLLKVNVFKEENDGYKEHDDMRENFSIQRKKKKFGKKTEEVNVSYFDN